MSSFRFRCRVRGSKAYVAGCSSWASLNTRSLSDLRDRWAVVSVNQVVTSSKAGACLVVFHA